MHRPDGLLEIVRPDEARDDDIGAKRDAHEQVDEQADDRRIIADGRQRLRADKLAEHQDIGRVEELLQDAGHGQWQRKQDHRPDDWSVQHVDLQMFPKMHCVSPFCFFL